ncbi:MAG: hypothetical protein HQL50_11380 [Magnetococcales bacterium]|nr:hypothetical protein [Magnetococcales bacterium]
MGGFSKMLGLDQPKHSALPPPSPPPESLKKHEREINTNREKARRRTRNAYGRNATILTGGQGVQGSTATASTKKTLLGQ